MAPVLLMLLAQAATLPAPPSDWSTLPQIYLTSPSTVSTDDTVAIMDLVHRTLGCRAGVRPMPRRAEAGSVRMEGVRIDLIVLVAPDGRFLNILAAPGACPAIRNYSRTIVNVRYRGRVRPPAGPDPAWYRTALTYSWEP